MARTLDGIPVYRRAMTAAERQRRSRLRKQLADESAGIVKPAKSPPPPSDPRARDRAKWQRRVNARPFVGFGGVGWGADDAGREQYWVLRMGARELYTGKPLTTLDCLRFIAASPPSSPHGPIYVGYDLGYHVTMILASLPAKRLKRIIDRPAKEGANSYTWIGSFGVNYLPRNHFRVCRGTPDGFGGWDIVPKSARTISDVFGFWREGFASVLARYGIGKRRWPVIQAGRVDRADPPATEARALRVRRALALECGLLASVMERFRLDCQSAGVMPITWQGAGKLANALHQRFRTITAGDVVAHRPAGCAVPAGVLQDAKDAYYGGRFETPRIGAIPGPVYEYDRRSAYPDAMTRLPCLQHGTWREATPASLRSAAPGSLYVASVRFSHDPIGPAAGALCGLPVRRIDGRLLWPLSGNGTYWSCEIESAASLGAKVIYRGGWHFDRQCDCLAFAWVKTYYDARVALGELAGYPIKIGTGSALYGKFAQRIGAPRYQNFIWAGLVTAIVRAEMNHAAALRPGAIAMVATDGIWSTVRLDLPLGEGLGEYREVVHDRLFVVQPGLYWTGARTRSRGIGGSVFADKVGSFEAAWTQYATRRAKGFADAAPAVSLNLRLFIGLRLSLAMKQPERARRWVSQAREFGFSWAGKRAGAWWEGEGADRCVVTAPLAGGRLLDSAPHMAHPELIDEMDQSKLEVEDQPDWIDFTPP